MSIEQVSASPAKVVECVAYQCAECRRKHFDRELAEKCCRCFACGAAIRPPGSIGYCDGCIAERDAEHDDDDWEDDDE